MSKPKAFRRWNPEQTLLLPPSPMDWLPEHHLVFFLLDLAGELDLNVIYAVDEQRNPRGVKAYEPRMIVVLLLYAYCVGLPSSRKIEKACWEDAAFRVRPQIQKVRPSAITAARKAAPTPTRTATSSKVGMAGSRATAAPATSRPASSANSMPKSPPAGSNTANGPVAQVGPIHGIWMPAAGWIASSTPRRAKRSKPCARQSTSRYLARSKQPEAWITSY